MKKYEQRKQLHFFPAAFPDESFFSLITRYHHLCGNLDDRKTLCELFGKHTQVVTSHLPSLVDDFVTVLPSGTPFDAPAIIGRLTIFPYFRPFLSKRQASLGIAAMRGASASGLKAMMGLIASKVGGGNLYRYCAKCVEEDDKCYGQAYWHRSHQLPGVLICQQHSYPLHEVDASWVSLHRHRLFIPTSLGITRHSRIASIPPRHFDLIHMVALLSEHVLQSNSAPVPAGQLQNIYRELASDLYLLGSGNRLRIPEVSALLDKQTTGISQLSGFEFTHAKSSNGPDWALSLLRKPRGSSHPLKHILLLHCLQGSWANVMKYTPNKAGRAQRENTPLCGVKNEDNNLAFQLRCLLVDQKYSLQRCAKILGRSVTTLRIEAARTGLPVSVKPKILGEGKLAVLRKELASTTPLRVLAEHWNVSVVSLYRVLRMYPDIALVRKRLIFEEERNERRDRFLSQSMKSHARRLPDYAWLHRNDREWLTQALSAGTKRILERSTRINWSNRDRQFARDVDRFGQRLLKLEKPVRITRALLGRTMGKLTILEKHIQKLPLTAAALAKNVETTKQFQSRRLLWAAKKILTDQPSAPAWLLLRVAGIRPKMAEEILPLVRELSLCTDIAQLGKCHFLNTNLK